MTILSADEFMRLRYSEDPVDYQKAAGEDAPIEVWREIIDRHPEARIWVAHNKTVPLEILEILVNDPDVAVRHAVAMKRKLTPVILERLAVDSAESIRMRVAMHRNVSRETLEGLRNDSWDRVREIARERLSQLGVK
jgi:phosphoserine phosphatase